MDNETTRWVLGSLERAALGAHLYFLSLGRDGDWVVMGALGRHFQVITHRLSSRVLAASPQASSGQFPVSGHEIPAVRFNSRPSVNVCFLGLRRGHSSALLADLTCSNANFGPSVSLKDWNFYEEERLGGRPGLQSLLHSSRSKNPFARTVLSRGYTSSYTSCRGD